jgi:hypothetical protein
MLPMLLLLLLPMLLLLLQVDAAAVLLPLLRDCWTLWQLLLTAEPLLVVGLSPGDTCAAVAALLNLLAPLQYAADYRPFFTMHDSDFVPLSRWGRGGGGGGLKLADEVK